MTRRRVWIAAAVVAVALVALDWCAYGQAKQFETLARAGKSDASAALKSLERADASSALTSFRKAGEEFSAAGQLLGPEWLRGVPWLGRQLAVADDLATIGAEGSSAGAHAAELLVEAGSVSGDDRLGQMLTLAAPHLDAALVSMVAIQERTTGLTTDGLVPQLADAVTELQDLLQPLDPVLGRSQALLDLERYVFSSEHRFLVLAQNNAQLRPTGGFPGTFGLVRVGPQGLHLSHFADIYTLPNDTLKLPVPDGSQMQRKGFWFRNANWWLDFPTSADTMVRLWDSMKPPQAAIDGVIAIDLPTIRDLLTVFGPITVPESPVPLTAKNVVEKLSYIVEIEYSGQGDAGKKNAVVSLAGAVMDRLTNLSDDEFVPTIQALANSANDKHIQLFFTDAAAQADMVAAGWSGALAPSADTTDLVAVSDAVVKRPAKSNLGVSKTLDYRVSLNPDGSAETSLRLGYAKSSDNPLGSLQDRFSDYMRVNRIDGTTLVGGAGVESLDDATGLPTFARYFELDSGKSTSLRVDATVPNALRPEDRGTATAGSSGGSWHYRLLLAKQADLQDSKATVTVTVPDGWQVTTAAASFRVSGTDVPVSAKDGTLTLTTALKQDVLLDVTLAHR